MTLDQDQTVAITGPPQQVDPFVPSTGVITTLTGELKAANGKDALTFTDANVPFEPDMDVTVGGLHPIKFSGEMTITGGEGRFAGATGDLDFYGGFCFVSKHGFYVIDGTVTLD